MHLVDGHLDLALNALMLRRDITRPLGALREHEADAPVKPFGTATVTLPALRAGGAVVVVSTVLARTRPWRSGALKPGGAGGDFPNQDMAHAVAHAQLAYYRRLELRGELQIVTTAEHVRRCAEAKPGAAEPLGVIVTMEGADPIADPDDLYRWHAAGLRTLMLSHFGKSSYAHGTPEEEDPHPMDVDGPLTDAGRRLLPEIESLGMPLDLTHLSDTSLHEAMERFGGAVYASHCGCRSLCGVQRNLTDEVIRAIAQRGGVIGVPFFNAFLRDGYERDSPRDFVTLDHVIDHLDHLCDIAGSDRHAALGTDMDGGFGLEHTPAGLDGSHQMHRLAERMRERGYTDDATDRILAGNWLRFYAETLPDPRKD